MITGVTKRSIPYVPESERTATKMQTVVWLVPKDGHSSNLTAARYAKAERTGRRGRRELDVETMDMADIEEFVSIVEKWEWFQFSDRFPELNTQVNKHPETQEELDPGIFPLVTDRVMLERIALDISPDLMIEIFETANSMSKLVDGEKKTPPLNLLRAVEVDKQGEKPSV